MTTAEKYDVVIIGGGLTGLAAARRARQRQLATAVLAASPGSLPYTSGAIDVLAVYPTQTKRYRRRPYKAVSELATNETGHPYAKVNSSTLREALQDYIGYLRQSPLGYFCEEEQNIAIITCAGTVKPTYAIPASMKNNHLALVRRRPTLILGFHGLMDFAPEQVAGNLQERWPGIRAARLEREGLFDADRRLSAHAIASYFEREDFRERFARAVLPLIGGMEFLGLPAVLGFDGISAIQRDLEERLGLRIFEIPLLSPSCPGTRLADMLRSDLRKDGVALTVGASVDGLDGDKRTLKSVRYSLGGNKKEVRATSFIMATGRFFGGGLVATQHGVREPLTGLEIQVPGSRDDWHMSSFLGAPGHPINRAGLQVDGVLRPIDANGKVIYENLFAAGALLAGHDWVREKSGAGISISTGYAAVDAIFDRPGAEKGAAR
jgi:glycerol-3-phosphate dehydrogenase subunit B